jgi:hypothetical protein
MSHEGRFAMGYEFLMMAAATMAIGLVVSLVLLGACYFTEREHHHRGFLSHRRARPLPPSKV